MYRSGVYSCELCKKETCFCDDCGSCGTKSKQLLFVSCICRLICTNCYSKCQGYDCINYCAPNCITHNPKCRNCKKCKDCCFKCPIDCTKDITFPIPKENTTTVAPTTSFMFMRDFIHCASCHSLVFICSAHSSTSGIYSYCIKCADFCKCCNEVIPHDKNTIQQIASYGACARWYREINLCKSCTVIVHSLLLIDGLVVDPLVGITTSYLKNG